MIISPYCQFLLIYYHRGLLSFPLMIKMLSLAQYRSLYFPPFVCNLGTWAFLTFSIILSAILSLMLSLMVIIVTKVPLIEHWLYGRHCTKKLKLISSAQHYVKTSSVPGIVQTLHSITMSILQVVKLRLQWVQYFAHVHIALQYLLDPGS